MAPALTYDEALAYLAQFINYEAHQPVAYAPEHFNVQAFADFLQTLGSPHLTFPSVHIAGSKRQRLHCRHDCRDVIASGATYGFVHDPTPGDYP